MTLCFLGMDADGKRHSCLPVCGTCVWSCAQIPEKHRAKPCFALQNKNTACQFRYGVGTLRRGAGVGLCQLSAMSEPISTNRLCQLRDGTWGSVVVLKYRSMSGVKYQLGAGKWGDGGGRLKDWGTWNINDVDFFPRLSPGRPCCLRPVRAAATVLEGGRGVWFQALGLLFGSLGAHDFRVMGSRLRRAPAASLLAMITPNAHTSPTHTLTAP